MVLGKSSYNVLGSCYRVQAAGERVRHVTMCRGGEVRGVASRSPQPGCIRAGRWPLLPPKARDGFQRKMRRVASPSVCVCCWQIGASDW